jgi:nitrite reductase (NAD(P)H)
MEECGVKRDAVGCEVCKPAIGSILSSLWNEHVMNPIHHQNQDTNDRFMANIQVCCHRCRTSVHDLIPS